jgi:hypothetical protein
MVRCIFKSRDISEDAKVKVLTALKEIDSSDKWDLTRQYCSAANPNLSSKQDVWDMLHGAEAEKISLYGVGELTNGFR